MRFSFLTRALLGASLTLGLPAASAFAQTPPLAPDIDGRFTAPADAKDFVKRVEMVPMRDGVKLYTVIVIPKGARNAPIVLTRTPYNAAEIGRAHV